MIAMVSSQAALGKYYMLPFGNLGIELQIWGPQEIPVKCIQIIFFMALKQGHTLKAAPCVLKGLLSSLIS